MNYQNNYVLFFTEIDTFPVNGGEKIRSYGLIKLLSEYGFNVIVTTGNYSNNNTPVPKIQNVTISRFNFLSIKSNNRFYNFFKIFKKEKIILNYFENILAKYEIKIVFLDYFYNGQYISYFQKKNIKVIYGTHNVQSRLILQRPHNGLKTKIAIHLEYYIHRLHEKLYFKKADALIAVSDLDKKDYDKYTKPEKVFVIPNFLVDEDYSIQDKSPQNNLIMTANFYAYQNFAGLEWFVKKVWTPEIYKLTKLVIIGWGSIKFLNELKNENDTTNIEAIGEVEDMKPYILNAKAAIVPLLHGSGSRLKCLEAMALKTPLISTSKGLEGIDHKGNCHIADNEVDFRNSILEILNSDNDKSELAYLIYKERYSLSSNLFTFDKIIKLLKLK
jgi:polysaccharide biosynthesis protein PslH